MGGVDAHGIRAQEQRDAVPDDTVILYQKNAHDVPYGITRRPASPPASGSRCQRVSPVRLMRVMTRRLRSRQTPKAEMWLLPVVPRRHGLLLAARTPLRDLVMEKDARAGATGADCRTAARRSRGKAKKKDKSGNILLAPSMKPRFCADLRGMKQVGPGRIAICQSERRCAVYGIYLCKIAYSQALNGVPCGQISQTFHALILPYREHYAFGLETAMRGSPIGISNSVHAH